MACPNDGLVADDKIRIGGLVAADPAGKGW